MMRVGDVRFIQDAPRDAAQWPAGKGAVEYINAEGDIVWNGEVWTARLVLDGGKLTAEADYKSNREAQQALWVFRNSVVGALRNFGKAEA